MLREGLSACLLLGLLNSGPVFSVPSDSMLAGSTKLTNGNTMYFRLYVPRNYSSDLRYPLVMCLHGVGERGSDNRAQVDRENMSHQWMLDSVKSKYKPFVLYPQCPANDEWTNWNATANSGYSAPAGVGAVKVIDSLIKVYPIDTSRLYVGGLSWGGMGTEGIMITYPDKFAASFPCAGENRIMTPEIMAKTPFWIWHGAKDPTVDPKPDTTLVNTLIAQDTPVVRIFYQQSGSIGNYSIAQRSISADSVAKKVAGGSMYLFTDITNGDHNGSWSLCFLDPVLVPWLMSKSKVNKKSMHTWPAPGPAGMTKVIAERKIPSSGMRGTFQFADGAIHWTGVLHTPATLNLFSAKGALVRRYNIGTAEGGQPCAGLPAGVYIATMGTTRLFTGSNMLVISGR